MDIDIYYFFFHLGILETSHLCDDIILFSACVNTADAWWGNLETERGLARAPRAGVGGQEAALGATRHSRAGPAGALPPHLLWDMALGAVKPSGESVQLLPRAAAAGVLGLALWLLFQAEK